MPTATVDVTGLSPSKVAQVERFAQELRAEADVAPESEQKLALMSALAKGWDGYEAEPPSARAVSAARRVIAALERADLGPSRVAPSVVGGVGLTRKQGARRAYVEVYNDGTAHALFAEGANSRTEPVELSAAGLAALAERVREYLNGR